MEEVSAGRQALPVIVRPSRGESAVGFMMRLADVNGISYPALFENVSNGRRNPDNWQDKHWQRLATLAFIDVEEFDGMRCRPIVDPNMHNAVTFLGKEVMRNQLVADQLRLCPHCIEEGGLMRECWKLSHWVACIEHGTYLVDRCDCGRPLHVVRRGADADGVSRADVCPCGKRFGLIVTTPADAAALDATHWIVQLFGVRGTVTSPDIWHSCKQLGPPFEGLSRAIWPKIAPIDINDLNLPPIVLPIPTTVAMQPIDALGLIETIGRLKTTSPENDKPRATNPSRTPGRSRGQGDIATITPLVTAAMEVVAGWPGTWHTLLADIAGRNVQAGNATPENLFATEMGRIVLRPFVGVDGYPITVLSDETNRWLEARGYRLRRRATVKESAVARRVYTLASQSEVARQLGIKDNPGLRRVYQKVVRELDDTDTTGLDAAALASAILEGVRKSMTVLDDYVSINTVAETLCSRSRRTGGAIWSDPRLLVPLRIEATANSRFRGDVYARTAVEEMQQRLAGAARLIKPNALPTGFDRYADVTGDTVSHIYTASDLIVDILSGEVPSVCTTAMPTLADLWIARKAATDLATTRRITILVAEDRFVTTATISNIVASLWPEQQRVFSKALPKLRDNQVVRFEEMLDEVHDKIRYRTAVADCLGEASALLGPTGIPAVDELIGNVNSPYLEQEN